MNGNMNNLDEKLERTEGLRGLVHSLPEETVSLKWRSELNERLLMDAAKPKRSWFAWMWRPAAGLAVAGAVTAVVFMNAPKPVLEAKPTEGTEVASKLFHAHETAVAYRTFGTPAPISEGHASEAINSYEEADLGAL